MPIKRVAVVISDFLLVHIGGQRLHQPDSFIDKKGDLWIR